MSDSSQEGQKFNVIVRYPKGVTGEQFKAYLETKNINLDKLKKYLKELDEKGEVLVLRSADQAKLQKAVNAFYNLGFLVEKSLHFELVVDDSEGPGTYSIYRCPVCDTPRDQDEPGQEQPCPVCKFLHLPDASSIFIMKKRIEWEETQRVNALKRNENTSSASEDKQEEFKRKLEEKLRKEIRADLMKKYNIKEDKKNWLSLWKLLPVAAVLAIAFFSSGYYVGDKDVFGDFFASDESPKIKIDNEKLLATLENFTQESKEFEFMGEDGISVQPELISPETSLTESSLVSTESQEDEGSRQCGVEGDFPVVPYKILRTVVFPH